MDALKKTAMGIALATMTLASAAGEFFPYAPDYCSKPSYSERRRKEPGDGNAEYYLDEKGNIRRRKK